MMNDNDFDAFADTYGGAWELAGKSISESAIMMAFEMLRSFTLEQVQSGIHSHMSTPSLAKYSPAPKPADVVRQIKGDSETRSLSALTLARKAVAHGGCYRTVVIGDPLIHMVIDDMGGWIKFCNDPQNDREATFQGKEFTRRYEGYCNSMPAHGTPIPRLVGISERDNAANGYEHREDLMLIGDQSMCEKITARIDHQGDTPRIPVSQKRVAQIASAMAIEHDGD